MFNKTKFFSFPTVFHRLYVPVPIKDLKSSKGQSQYNRSYQRKHSSCNGFSVFFPLIPWLYEITLCHRIRYLHNLQQVSSLAYNNWLSAAALALLAVLGKQRMRRPIGWYWLLRGKALKRQELKQSTSDIKRIQSCSTRKNEKTDVFFEHQSM